jgi:hypothetical protein
MEKEIVRERDREREMVRIFLVCWMSRFGMLGGREGGRERESKERGRERDGRETVRRNKQGER